MPLRTCRSIKIHYTRRVPAVDRQEMGGCRYPCTLSVNLTKYLLQAQLNRVFVYAHFILEFLFRLLGLIHYSSPASPTQTVSISWKNRLRILNSVYPVATGLKSWCQLQYHDATIGICATCTPVSAPPSWGHTSVVW